MLRLFVQEKQATAMEKSHWTSCSSSAPSWREEGFGTLQRIRSSFERFCGRGVPVESWDIIHGSAFDLSRLTTQFGILKATRRKEYLMVHIGMPCSSWSRIKDINKEGKRPGCRPLRTDAQPMGIDRHANGDSLTESEQSKLREANQLLLFVLV